MGSTRRLPLRPQVSFRPSRPSPSTRRPAPSRAAVAVTDSSPSPPPTPVGSVSPRRVPARPRRHARRPAHLVPRRRQLAPPRRRGRLCRRRRPGLTGILQGWFGILRGQLLAERAGRRPVAVRHGRVIVGMNALIGRAGIAVGAVLTVLVGNPLSAAAQPLQFMVGPWGAIGQWFVPGASVTLLRDLSYFPDADSDLPVAGPARLGGPRSDRDARRPLPQPGGDRGGGVMLGAPLSTAASPVRARAGRFSGRPGCAYAGGMEQRILGGDRTGRLGHRTRHLAARRRLGRRLRRRRARRA